MRLTIYYVLASLLLLSPTSPARAGGTPKTIFGPERCDQRTTYCGLNCLYATLKLYDRPIEYEQLLRAKYISRRSGSSVAELTDAAGDFGLRALPLSNLTAASLTRLTSPAILHVRCQAADVRPSHYVLLLGAEGGKLRIYDPPRPIMEFSPPEFSPLWDGTAIVVSNNAADLDRAVSASRWASLRLVAVVAAVLGVAAVARLFVPGPGRGRMPIAGEAAAVVLVSAAGAAAFHRFSGHGYVAHAQAVEAIRYEHLDTFLRRIGIKEAQTMLETGAAQFVDARHRDEFNRCHIPGAVNVEWLAPKEQREAVMLSVPKDKPLVLYCDNRKCRLAAEVAKAMSADGYGNLYIFEGGWSEWEAVSRKFDPARPAALLR